MRGRRDLVGAVSMTGAIYRQDRQRFASPVISPTAAQAQSRADREARSLDRAPTGACMAWVSFCKLATPEPVAEPHGFLAGPRACLDRSARSKRGGRHCAGRTTSSGRAAHFARCDSCIRSETRRRPTLPRKRHRRLEYSAVFSRRHRCFVRRHRRSGTAHPAVEISIDFRDPVRPRRVHLSLPHPRPQREVCPLRRPYQG